MSQQEPQAPGPYPAEDEIDLADLAAVLHRRRWLIAGGTLAVLLLGLLYTLTIPQTFEYRSLLEVGQYQKEGSGDYQFVESPQAAAGRLEALAQTVYQQELDRRGPEEMEFSLGEFQVSPAENGGVLEITMEASREAEVRPFLSRITSKLIEDHNSIFAVQEQAIHQRTQSLEAQLAELREKTESYKRRLKILDREEEFLNNQVQEATKRLDSLLTTKAQANLDSSGEPIGLLLFNSEIQRIRAHVDDLRNRVLSDIPEKRENLRGNIQSTQSQIATTESKLESQQVALKNMNRTHTLLEPTVSNNPVSPKLKMNLALSLVLGLFLAAFAAFVYEFWRNNRDRITQAP